MHDGRHAVRLGVARAPALQAYCLFPTLLASPPIFPEPPHAHLRQSTPAPRGDAESSPSDA